MSDSGFRRRQFLQLLVLSGAAVGCRRVLPTENPTPPAPTSGTGATGLRFELENALLLGQWDRVPRVLASLFPRFTDITIARYTRSPELWSGCYQRLAEGER